MVFKKNKSLMENFEGFQLFAIGRNPAKRISNTRERQIQIQERDGLFYEVHVHLQDGI